MNLPKPLVASFVGLAATLMVLNVALVKRNRALATLNRTYEANFHLNVGDIVPPPFRRQLPRKHRYCYVSAWSAKNPAFHLRPFMHGLYAKLADVAEAF